MGVIDLGHDQPTLILTNDETVRVDHLIERYAHRTLIENSLGEQVKSLHLNALRSGVPMNVDLDVTLTLVAYTLYRLLAQQLRGHEQSQAGTLYRRFVDTPGQLVFSERGLTIRLRPRSHTPVLLHLPARPPRHPGPWLAGS